MTGGGALSARRLALYALPALPLALPTIPVAVLLPAHYAETLGLGLGGVALALTAARALDLLTDPLVGALSDRSGRRKPWIALGGLLAGLGLLALFNPPDQAGAAHLFGWSLLLYVGWSMVQIPYQAWGAELATGYDARARISGARESVGVLGLILAGAVPAAAAALGFSAAQGLSLLAMVTVALGALALSGLLWGVAEVGRPADEGQARVFPSLRPILSNRPFLRLLAAWMVNGLATGVPATLFPFFVGSVLMAGDVAKGVFLLVYFLSAVAAVPLWLRLAARVEKHRAWCLAMLTACAAFAPVPWLGAGDLFAFGLVCVVTGAALGADLALPPAMQADVVDYARWRERGPPRAGLLFALWTMASKLALALSVALALPLVAAFGFDPRVATPSATALLAVGVIYAGVPTVAKLIAVALVWGHPLSRRRHAAIRNRLDRRATAQGLDPAC